MFYYNYNKKTFMVLDYYVNFTNNVIPCSVKFN